MHINVYFFLFLHLMLKKKRNGFVGFLFFLYKISSTIILCSSLNSLKFVMQIFHMEHVHQLVTNMHYQKKHWIFFLGCIWFSNVKSYGSTSFMFVNNMFFGQSLALIIVSFEKRFFHPCISFIFVYSFTCSGKWSHSSPYLLFLLNLYTNFIIIISISLCFSCN
jgi:hypothetical protein